MATDRNKGTGLHNVSETWDENERRRSQGDAPATDNTAGTATGGNDLERIVKEEAAEYDGANKEDRILGGDRATVNDDPDANAPSE